MRLISCYEGRLLSLDAARLSSARGGTFHTGLEALDALAPGGAFSRGAIHELLCEPAQGMPLFLAMLLARNASRVEPLAASRIADLPSPQTFRPILWSDPDQMLYPPALASHGISLNRLFFLRVSLEDQTWAIAECLRCKGIGAVVASIPLLSRLEARRLQLAAETGGGVGILLRPAGKASQVYAAVTRWLVRPAPGERTLQRWTVQLLHGHGGRLGQAVTLEYCRENHLVRAVEKLGDRSGEKKAARAAS